MKGSSEGAGLNRKCIASMGTTPIRRLQEEAVVEQIPVGFWVFFVIQPVPFPLDFMTALK